jgi:hypothetical protein
MGSNPEIVRAATVFAKIENRVSCPVGLHTAVGAAKRVE